MKWAMTAAAAAMLCADAADATVVTRTYGFAADNFVVTYGSGPAPVPVVYGSFTVTFDDAATDLSTAGITLNSLNIKLDSPLAWESHPGFFDLLSFGGTDGGQGGVVAGDNDFYLQFLGAPDAPYQPLFYYSQAGAGIYQTYDVNISVDCVIPQAPPVAVPEPATWAMMILGFGAVGLATRARRRPILA